MWFLKFRAVRINGTVFMKGLEMDFWKLLLIKTLNFKKHAICCNIFKHYRIIFFIYKSLLKLEPFLRNEPISFSKIHLMYAVQT